MSSVSDNPWLHRFALLTAAATLALLSVGGLVTSHGVGMAVPDWPNTYGYNLFFFPCSQWIGGVFYEHTHRLAASAVGLMTSILALWLYGRSVRRFMRWTGLVLVGLAFLTALIGVGRRSDGIVLGVTGLALFGASFVWPRGEAAAKWLRHLGLAAFLAVVLQGVLGGLRVVLTEDQLGIPHAMLAQFFFSLVCAIALFTSPWWRRTGAAHSSANLPGLREVWMLGAGAWLLILTQLAIGAAMRHQHAGLAISDFPLAHGKLWPATDPASVELYNQQRKEIYSVNPITAFQIVLQMVHRITAALILGAVAGYAWTARRVLGKANAASRGALLWLGLVLTQGLLGAATIWSDKAADVATAHVVAGALLLATGALLCIINYRELALARSVLQVPPPFADWTRAPFGQQTAGLTPPAQ